MECLGVYERSEVGLDMDGMLDNPDYIKGLPAADRDRYAGRNVFPFSMATAAYEVLQFIGLITGFKRIGGIGPQRYDGYPGSMKAIEQSECKEGCEIEGLTATAIDLECHLDQKLKD